MKETKALLHSDQINWKFLNKITIKINIHFNKIKYIKIKVANYMEAQIRINMIITLKIKNNKIGILCNKYFLC